MRRFGTAALIVAPLLVLLSIWLPLWQHYWVAHTRLDAEMIGALRSNPPDERLSQLDRQAQGIRTILTDAQVLSQAKAIGRGQIELPSAEIRRVTLPFDQRDFDAGTSGGALNMASLVVPDTLLRAYEITGDEAYFTQARDAILGFAKFERGLLTDVGNVRNDHAIAARAGVMIRFWRLYRHRSDFDEMLARSVVNHAARCAGFLVKNSHYTAATNHGVMQNIAVLQVAAVFQALPEVSQWIATAHARLRQQMAFFVNAEGVILEHSSDYQRFGILLLSMVQQLLEWNGLPAIDGLAQKYALGTAFLDRLRRPDGSVPRIGDTNGEIVLDGTEARYPIRSGVTDKSLALPDATHIYPSAGYAVTTRPLARHSDSHQGMSHSTLYWSHFPRHGHEVAAEGSFLLWAAGTDWVENTGYWPYDLPGRADTEGWRGSNAAHFRGESTFSRRTSSLLAYAGDASSHLIDVARSIDGGARLRRQVVQVDDKTWLVLDSRSATSAQPVDRIWTLAPQLAVEDDGNGEGILAKDPSTGWTLRIDFLGEHPPQVRRLKGSLQPFGGWAMIGPSPIPSVAYEFTQAGASRWVATLFTLVPPGSALTARKSVMQYSAEEDWSISVDAAGPGAINVQRRQDQLSIDEPGSKARQIGLHSPNPESLAERAVIQQALASTLQEHRRFQPHAYYRLRLSAAITALLLLSLLVWVLIRRRFVRFSALATKLALVFWASLATWIHLVYFGM